MAINTTWDEWTALDLILDERLSGFSRYVKNFVMQGFGLLAGVGLQVLVGGPGLNVAYINGYEYKQTNAIAKLLVASTTNYIFLNFTKTPDPIGGSMAITLFITVNQTGVPPANSLKLGEVDTDALNVIAVREQNNHFHIADSQFDTDLEGNHHQIKELLPHHGTVFPSGPILGQHFFRDDQKVEFFWDGTSWLPIGGGVDAMDIFKYTLFNLGMG